jgi:hypothetical protein
MPTFRITADDGHTYNVTAPDEATASAEFLKQYKPMGNAQQAVEMIKNPGRSLADILRTTSNFVTFGGRDKLAGALSPYLGTLPPEQQAIETAGADARLGTFDEAANLGLLALQPSAAARYVPETAAGRLGKVAGFAGEGAAQSGIQAIVEDKPVLPAMAEGGAFGAAGAGLTQLKPLAQSLLPPLGRAMQAGGNVLRGGSDAALQDVATMISPRLPATGRSIMRVGGGLSQVAPPSDSAPWRNAFAKMLSGMERLQN